MEKRNWLKNFSRTKHSTELEGLHKVEEEYATNSSALIKASKILRQNEAKIKKDKE